MIPDDEEVLRKALLGEELSSQEDERLKAADLQARLRSLQRAQGCLDRSAAFEEELLDRARSEPNTDRDREQLERFMGVAAAPPRTARHDETSAARRWTPLALAAAALFVAAAWWWWPRSSELEAPEPDGQQLLDSGTLVCEHPRGPGHDFERFRWRGELPAGARFVLRVFSAMPGDEDSDALLTRRGLEECECALTAKQAEALPNRIEWVVTVETIEEGPIFTATASARRSP